MESLGCLVLNDGKLMSTISPPNSTAPPIPPDVSQPPPDMDLQDGLSDDPVEQWDEEELEEESFFDNRETTALIGSMLVHLIIILTFALIPLRAPTDEDAVVIVSPPRVTEEVEELIERKSDEIKRRAMDEKLLEEATDFTLPGRGMPVGAKHPITQVMERIVYDFERMGFEVAEGPEVELDYYNFEALNIPKNHPARDMQDTFYITDDMVLRTHTSPVQIRIMQTQQPPVKIIAPGKVYRCDSDVSHTPMFHQIEGLLVDKGITFGNLKSVIIQFVKLTFGDNTNVRFRPSFFPFTEPSAEVDIECQICSGD